MRIRRGGPGDADAVIALFDEAVAWMVARGQTGQWGSEPMSRNEKMVARVRSWARGDGLWMMEDEGSSVGALVVGERPPHVHPVDEPELYVELVLSSRARAGERIGARLVEHAVGLAESAGVPLLRVDCWAGAPRLVESTRRRASCATGPSTCAGGSVRSSRCASATSRGRSRRSARTRRRSGLAGWVPRSRARTRT
jgi:GNAT superfamily N-acetyltransferase